MSKEQPGIMMYFENWRALEDLDYEKKGMLMEALVDYVEYGVMTDLPRELRIVWPFFKNTADRDMNRYRERCRSGRYARYCAGLGPDEVKLDYEDWAQLIDRRKNPQ